MYLPLSFLQATKQISISHPAPPVLILHLKRFQFGGMSDKIRTHVQFDDKITVPLTDVPSNEAKSAMYELYGVVVHIGHGLHSGHYIAYVKVI